MLSIALLASLVTYSVVASQPLCYLVVFGQAQRALSAPAYIELRQHVNAVMVRRVPVIYLSALIALAALLFIAARSGAGLILGTAALALACLVADAILMTRASVPINSVIDAWTVTEHPDDWQDHRARWFAIFGYRQVALLVGFGSLLLGAALH
jgi:hypothetical protein